MWVKNPTVADQTLDVLGNCLRALGGRSKEKKTNLYEKSDTRECQVGLRRLKKQISMRKVTHKE